MVRQNRMQGPVRMCPHTRTPRRETSKLNSPVHIHELIVDYRSTPSELLGRILGLDSSGGSRKLRTGGGGATGGGHLRQNQVLAVCTERSTGKSPPPLPYHYGSERGGRAPGYLKHQDISTHQVDRSAGSGSTDGTWPRK